MKGKLISYFVDGKEFEGYFVNRNGRKNPGVILFHSYKGQAAFDHSKAEELAEQGYSCFCADVYGINRRAKSPEEADSLMGEMNADRNELLKRILGALSFFQDHVLVEEAKVAAIGFCFGGKCVLDLARSGTSLSGVISFHGVYDRSEVFEEKEINCSVLVLDGWDDPLVPPAVKVGLGEELTHYKADWQMLTFGNTGHAFTNPVAQDIVRKFYFQEHSNRRAWDYAKYFLNEKFMDS